MSDNGENKKSTRASKRKDSTESSFRPPKRKLPNSKEGGIKPICRCEKGGCDCGNPVCLAGVTENGGGVIPSGSCEMGSSISSIPSAHYNWQVNETNFKDRFTLMFNNEIFSDVHFIVGKGLKHQQRIPAHRSILSCGSPVFGAMFFGAMATKQDEIEVPDVEPAAFLALLKYLYSDELEIDLETVMTTLYTAKKYAVSPLEMACVEILKSNLSSDNAFMLLSQARLFDEPELAARCLKTIDKNTLEALSAEGFTDIDLDTLCVVLERNTLRIREAELFQAVVRWAEQECLRQQLPISPENKRLALGRSLNLVRFPLMTLKEFAGDAAQSSILTDREALSLYKYFTVEPKPAVSFVDVPRDWMAGKEQMVHRFRQTNVFLRSGTSGRISFQVDRCIFVVGFGLYGSTVPTNYDVNIQIMNSKTNKILGCNNTKFTCDGSDKTFRVMFKEPIKIYAKKIVTASATFNVPFSYFGTNRVRTATLDSPVDGKVTFQFTPNNPMGEVDQIPEIIFYT